MIHLCFQVSGESFRHYAERALRKDVSHFTDDELKVLMKEYHRQAEDYLVQWSTAGLNTEKAKAIVDMYRDRGAVGLRVSDDCNSYIVEDCKGNEVARFVDTTGKLVPQRYKPGAGMSFLDNE